jgi:hypothetical protein
MKLYLILIFSLFLGKAFAEPEKTVDLEHWKHLVAGTIDEISNPNLKKYLQDTHRNNTYLRKIEKEMRFLGDFSPTKETVFWLPSINVPMDEKEWRYLSSTIDIPKDVANIAYLKKDGRYFAKMFIHPYTTKRKEFIELAERFGGFQYDHQAVTTASARSFVAWETSRPRSETFNKVDVPKNKENIFKTKVSIYNADIDGTRLNVAKKMVRASIVTRFMDSIDEKTKIKNALDFEGEWFIGVPDDTDAGYVVRQPMPELAGQNGKNRLEPAFSILSPDRLNELTKGKVNPFEWIMENLYSPLAKGFSFFLFEEGMIGENHAQNFEYVVDSDGKPTGKIIYRDADAFRTHITLRSMLGKDVASASEIEDPFFYMKESAFSAQVDEKGLNTTINELIGMIVDPGDETSMTAMVYKWCGKVQKFKEWCTPAKIRNRFLKDLSARFESYMGGAVPYNEIFFTEEYTGKIGLIKIFDDWLNLTASRVLENRSDLISDDKIQDMLAKEFNRLEKQGNARIEGSEKNLTTKDYTFYISLKNSNTHIMVMKKNPRKGSYPLKGLAIMGSASDSETKSFLSKIKGSLDGKSQKANCMSIMDRMVEVSNSILAKPIMRNLGGGNNVH